MMKNDTITKYPEKRNHIPETDNDGNGSRIAAEYLTVLGGETGQVLPSAD